MSDSPSNDIPSYEEMRRQTEQVFRKKPCIFQLQLCRAALEARRDNTDIISIAATGSGKTLTFLMPLLFNNGMTIIVITALNLLGEQFVEESKKADIPAISVTADNNNDKTFEEIKNLKYRVVVFSPEIATQRNGRCEKKLWPCKQFIARIFNLVLDEGHCVVQWGSTFRPHYNDIGVIWLFAPSIPFHALSATIPKLMIKDLKDSLRLNTDCKVFRRSNDRPNVLLSVRWMEHKQGSFRDLAFLIPKNWREGDSKPKKFMVFFDSKREAEDATLYLNSLISEEVRLANNKIVWFHSGMSARFRREKIAAFKEGKLWGLMLTDVGGMGLDTRDVHIVVQWKVPKDLSTMMQRFGRAARDPSLDAVAILIAESKWSYEAHLKAIVKRKRKVLNESSEVGQGGRKGTRVTDSSSGSRFVSVNTNSDEALRTGEAQTEHDELLVQAGLTSCTPEEIEGEIVALGKGKATRSTTSLKTSDIDGNLMLLMNASWLHGVKKCRRHHSNVFFGNDTVVPDSERCCTRCSPTPSLICCDLCNPHAVALCIPDDLHEHPPTTRVANRTQQKEFNLNTKEQNLRMALLNWREDTAISMWGCTDYYPADIILHSTIIDRIVYLVHRAFIKTPVDLVSQSGWVLSKRYGIEILSIIQTFCPPPRLLTSTPLRSPLAPLSSHISNVATSPLQRHSQVAFTATSTGPSTSSPFHMSSLPSRTTMMDMRSPFHLPVQVSQSSAPPPSKRRAAPQCTACFLVGHRRTSRSCPMYNTSAEGENNAVAS